MYYKRDINSQINELAKGFPVISVTGPRQSGKTTFLQNYFKNYKYFNLENPQTANKIELDPQQFLIENPKNIIIDEIQRVPELLSYIQSHVDERKEMGSIIISGSQNLLISEKISQSLAGRAAYQTIYPFSISELKEHKLLNQDHYKQILKGFYPAVYTREIAPTNYYDQYLATYVERDARLIRNISSLSQFRRFIGLLAGRVGQILNTSSLANDTGIAPNTAEDWISILEASYIVYRLQPYYKNVGKRLIRSPKVYFYDTGLLCRLLNISTKDELSNYYSIGSIFENLIISEIKKHINNYGKSVQIFFFRDSHGNEVDLIADIGPKLIPVEIKSSSTFNENFLKGLKYWRKNINSESRGYILYSGSGNQVIKGDNLLSWQNIDKLFAELK